MCGIYSKFISDSHDDFKTTYDSFEKLSHRGPDESIFKEVKHNNITAYLGFHRLSIMGIEDGMQPFHISNKHLLCNGEIYNYVDLIEKYELEMKTKSDCEVIIQLYLKIGIHKTISSLRGDFAFILYDPEINTVYFGRDPFGVRPLFIQHERNNSNLVSLTLASEAKGVINDSKPHENSCADSKSHLNFSKGEYSKGSRNLSAIKQVEPRKIFSVNLVSGILSETEYFSLSLENHNIDQETFKTLLIESVRKRLMSNREIGFLLSGGLDSSLILSIALSLELKELYPLKVFTVGFDSNAPDVLFAHRTVKFLQDKYGKNCIEHIVVIYDIQDGLREIPNVIRTIESYDTTTVRASTPMYLISKYISENTNVKVILSGEGSDEGNCLGYLYLLYAPNVDKAREESKRLLSDIHFFDGLRADRTISAFGLELRVPFLDSDYVSYCLSSEIPSRVALEEKTEKKYLRDAFVGYLPDEVLYRQKNAFSDAVSYDWKKEIKKYAEKIMTCNHPSLTSEELWYLSEYCRWYNPNLIPYMWLPKWVNVGTEPSATVLELFRK